MNRQNKENSSAGFWYGTILFLFILPSLVFGQTSSNVNGLTAVEAGYDRYLITTEKIGNTLGGIIGTSFNKTQTLYKSAWNELTSQGSTLMLPKAYLRLQEAGRQVEPLLNSYVEYSNNLGTSFANTLTQGMGASQEFSQKIWNQNPTVANLAKVGHSFSSYAKFSQNMGETYADTFTAYVTGTGVVGDALAEGIKSGFNNSATLYTNVLTKEKSLAVNTITDTTQSLASIGETINSISNYINSLWKNILPSSPPTPTPINKPTPQPTNQPPTIVTPPAKPTVVIPTPKPGAAITPIVSPPPTQPATTITNVIPTTNSPVVILPTTSSTELNTKIEQLRNELLAKIGSVSVQAQSNYSNNFQAIALTNKIDQLTNTVITTPAITGGTITNASISGGSISGTTISGTTLSVSSGTFSGNLTVSGTGTSTFAGDSAFDTDTLYVDSINNRVGVGTSSPSDTFALNGTAYFAQVSAPGVTVNRLYNQGGLLYFNGTALGSGGASGTFSTTTSQVSGQLINYPTNSTDIVTIGSSSTTTAPFWLDPNTTTGYISGNLGLGTTSPTYKLDVAGFINIDQYSGYKQAGNTILYASSTNKSLIVGIGAGAALLSDGIQNTALGYQALNVATSSDNNTAVGYLALSVNTIGYFNTAVGSNTLLTNTVGYANTTVGVDSLSSNTTGYSNSAFGTQALRENIYGYQNTALGSQALRYNNGGYQNVAVGESALRYVAGESSLNTAFGSGAGQGALNSSNFNNSVLFGYHAGYALRTGGDNNTLVGYQAGDSITTGSNNIIIGYDIDAPAVDSVNTLNIANLIFGTGIDGTGTTLSSGNVGIGTSSPLAKLSVQGTAGPNDLLNIASSTGASIFYADAQGRIGINTNTFPTYATTVIVPVGVSPDVSTVLGADVQIHDTNTATLALRAISDDMETFLTSAGSANGAVGTASNHDFAIATNNTDRVYIKNSGNIGLDTTSPYAKLSVVGSGAGTGQIFEMSDSASTTIVRFLDNGTGYFSGNIGLGTTSPSARLTVSGTTASDVIRTDMGLDINPVVYPPALGLALITTSGNLGSGLYYYRVSYYTAVGETGTNSLSSITTDGANQQVTVTVPTSTDPRVIGRKLYRSVVGGNSWDTRLLATIADNTTTTYIDNIADGSLGANGYFRENTTTKYFTVNGSNAILIGSGNEPTTIVGKSAGTTWFNGTATGGASVAIGASSLSSVTSGTKNSAVGVTTLQSITTGSSNNALGWGAFNKTTTGSQNTGIGTSVGLNNVTGSYNTLIGYYSGYGVSGNSYNYNSFLGTQTGYLITTGSRNTLLGYQTGYNLTTGGSNIAIGQMVDLPSNTGTGQLNIGNVIYGTGMYSGTSVSSTPTGGNIGIGTTSPSAMLHIGSATSGGNVRVANGWLCVDDNDTCTGATTAGTVYAVGAYTTGADLAENYQAFEEGLTSGDIVSITDTQTIATSTADSFGVKKAVQGETIIGIVSTKPGLLLANSPIEKIPVALQGRVPLKVNMEGGTIKTGDKITLSSTPGIGMKATSSSYTVGIALEPYDGTGKNTIQVFMNLGYSHIDPAIADGTILDGTGESSFWSVEEGSGRIKFISQGIDLNDQDIVSVRAITGSAGKWSIDGNGRLVVGEVEANKVTTKTLCIDDVCIEKDTLRSLLEKSGVISSPQQENPQGVIEETSPSEEENPVEEVITEEPPTEPIVSEPTLELEPQTEIIPEEPTPEPQESNISEDPQDTEPVAINPAQLES